jgi:hypothetical protein
MEETRETRNDPETCESAELNRLILEGDEKTLEKVLRNPNLTPQQVVLIFENKFVTHEIVKQICGEPNWVGRYTIKVAIVNSPLTPKVTALNLVKFLFWKDLVKVAKNARLLPPVRNMADVVLKDRLPEITVGEKVSLARIASRTLIRSLIHDRNEMVFRALLENPMLTEEPLIHLASSPSADPAILSVLATHKKWSYRYGIRLALLRNRRTPVAVAVGMLSHLMESDLKAVIDMDHVPRIVKMCAERIIHEKKSPEKRHFSIDKMSRKN